MTHPFTFPAACTAAALALAALAGPVHAQAPSSANAAIYPAKGQSAKQQDKDKYECHAWARSQTGFDPTQTAQATQARPVGAPGGLARGALGGAAIGELASHDPGHGAAVGVLAAGVRERVKQQQASQQQQAVRAQQKAGYDRSFGACLQGRGYVVS